MSEFRFSKEHGSFYYRCNGNILYMADDLAFLFSRSEHGTCLLKHGPAETINAYFKTLRARYIAAGLDGMLEDMSVIEARDWPVDVINRFIDTTGYIGVYLDRLSPDDKGDSAMLGKRAKTTSTPTPTSKSEPSVLVVGRNRR